MPFVLPTYFAEGFPLSVMEAMGHGLPIITTPIRGCADYLSDGENALFVPARDPAALARAVERLLGDDALRARMSAANLARVADFAPARVMPHYADILRAAAAAAARSPVLESDDSVKGGSRSTPTPASWSPAIAAWWAARSPAPSRLTATTSSSKPTPTRSTSPTRSPPRAFFERERPQAVILAAAKVGGIVANWEQP